MTRYSITSGLVIALVTANQGSTTTLPTAGPAPAGSTIAYYYIQTGEITVSVNGVINWYIDSDSDSLTGDDPLNLPQAGGAVSDNNKIIGETTGFNVMTYTDVELGPVAEPFLPEDDLKIFWNINLSTPLDCLPVTYISIPEPTACGLAMIATICLGAGRRRRKR